MTAAIGTSATPTGNTGMLLGGLATVAKNAAKVGFAPMAGATNGIKAAKVIMTGIVLMTAGFETIKDTQKMQEIRQGKQLNEPLSFLVDKFKYVDVPTTVLGGMYFGGMALEQAGAASGKAALTSLGKAMSFLPAQCPWLLLAGAVGIAGFYGYKSFSNGTFKPADALLGWGALERPHRLDDAMHGGVTVAHSGYVAKHKESAEKYGISQRRLSIDSDGALKALQNASKSMMVGNSPQEGGQVYNAVV